MFTDGVGTEWNSTTGSVGNMYLKDIYFSQSDSRFVLITKTPIMSTLFAPVAAISGTGLSALQADNTSWYNQMWDYSNTGGSSVFLRWGYKFSVTAKSVGLCLYALASWSGISLTLKGFSNNTFSSGVTLATISCNSIGIDSVAGLNYTWFTIGSPAAYSHYEISAPTGHGSYTWPVILAST